MSLAFAPMTLADISAVLSIEHFAHTHPWTEGQFAGSLAAGHRGTLLLESGELTGYALLMPLPDEIELLNITIAPAAQKRGLGRQLLDWISADSAHQGAQRMFLEVRASNLSARALYEKSGFEQIGLRRGYYPAVDGREDAIVMAKVLMTEATNVVSH